MSTDLVFHALADSTRRRLLRVLSVSELSVTDLVEVLEQPQSTISRHLKVLREADLVVDRRSGTTSLYTARPHQTPPTTHAVGNGAEIRSRLLQWASTQALEPDTDERLQRLLHRRHSDSGGFFERMGSRWDQLRVDAFGEVFHFEALGLLLPAEWTVADIGTGTGYLLPLLSSRFRSVIAVDPTEAMLQAARGRPELQHATNVSFREGSLDRLPLDDAEVDLAIASLVLHHVEQPQAALAELRRAVRPGGRVLLIEQDEHEHESFHDRMGDRWRGFEPTVLAAWLEAAGFVQARTAGLISARPRSRTGADVPHLFTVVATRAPAMDSRREAPVANVRTHGPKV